MYRHPLLAVILLASSSMAAAQYIWLDEHGVKQLSDRPPPPNVPRQRIVKMPSKTVFNPYAEPEVAAKDATQPPSVAERNAAFNQRQRDAAQQASQAADDAKRHADQRANCDAARHNQMALDQGLRLSTFDKTGQRAYMSDAEREELRKNAQKVLADCK
ncbi:DUF4124 domain-containing protein [Duganella sp. FT94W]|uniref:DUF4124 domain-containing protein n=1 Tax=Duganella lactea TaxID=2692173 RepID=A0ABW9V5N6_9BURK|nr:DUF4124 domain-containing protein [Duganella lactea]MYM34865.1 DUF4124 domain-containing protein [Duganella lactea]